MSPKGWDELATLLALAIMALPKGTGCRNILKVSFMIAEEQRAGGLLLMSGDDVDRRIAARLASVGATTAHWGTGEYTSLLSPQQ